jgi:succinate dehydrogenase / fumarate reductase membrane anchor subunit
MKNYLSLKSDISKAKNLGSAAHGSHHWLMQRFSALLLIPLVAWIAYFTASIAGLSKDEILKVISLPYNLVAINLLLATGIYHGALGMQIVIEDYISNLCLRNSLIIVMKIFSFVTIFFIFWASVYFLIHI